MEFNAAKRELWRLDLPGQAPGSHAAEGVRGEVESSGGAGFEGRREQGRVVGYRREHSTLRHVVIRNAGHMVRHVCTACSQVSLYRLQCANTALSAVASSP